MLDPVTMKAEELRLAALARVRAAEYEQALDLYDEALALADEEEIREHGFEQFIRGHIENTHMAFNSKFFEDHQDVVKALSDALWKRQTSPEQHRYHFAARRTWDTLANAPKVKVPALVLCGAGDDVNRGGSTPTTVRAPWLMMMVLPMIDGSAP